MISSQFTRYPIYHIQDDSGKFKAEVHTKEFFHYEGESDFEQVLAWIEEITEPVVVNAVADPPPRKLSHSIEQKKPILILVRRDSSSDKVMELLEDWCVGRTEFACAYASKEDEGYQPFNEWLADEGDSSKLVLINSEDFTKTIWDGNLSTIDSDKLEKFVGELFEKIKAAAAAQAEAKEAQEEVNEAVKEAVEVAEEVADPQPEEL